MSMIYRVYLTKKAEKNLKNIPRYILVKLQAWIDDVEDRGLGEVRKIAGYHDEPLKGKRKGERSIRLNHAFRAIYTTEEDREVLIVKVSIEEINKHDY